jgi:hypothetical protein
MRINDAEWKRRLEAVEATIKDAKPGEPADLVVLIDGDPERARQLRARHADAREGVKLDPMRCPSAEEYLAYQTDHRGRMKLEAGPGRYAIASTAPPAPERGRWR